MSDIGNSLIRWAKNHPKRDGGSWNTWCESMAFRTTAALGRAPVPTPGDAIASYRANVRAKRLKVTDFDLIPDGWFGFWEIGVHGHVADKANGQWLMASAHIEQSFGSAIGLVHHQRYLELSGARFLGAFRYLGGNGYLAGTATKALAPAVAKPAPKSYAYWEPQGDLARRIQTGLKHDHVYAGIVDGKFGGLTREGVERELVKLGQKLTIDGKMGSAECAAIQRVAATRGGYVGPQDRRLGIQSWTGFAKAIERT